VIKTYNILKLHATPLKNKASLLSAFSFVKQLYKVSEHVLTLYSVQMHKTLVTQLFPSARGIPTWKNIGNPNARNALILKYSAGVGTGYSPLPHPCGQISKPPLYASLFLYT
jgi:hypothetical protein